MMQKRAGKKWTALVLALLVLSFAQAEAQAAGLPKELVPVGDAVGIALRTKGAVVAELSEVETESGAVSPARDAGLLPGDVIVGAAGRPVNSGADLTEILAELDADQVQLQVVRKEQELTVTVRPVREGGRCSLGFYVRDGITGIGTLTWVDPETGRYGALGHAVSDSDSGLILPVGEGMLLDADVTGVTKGKSGAPGKLGGVFTLENAVGDIQKNCVVGIFGKLTDGSAFARAQRLTVAAEKDIQIGGAVILSAADGQVREYQVQITRLYRDQDDGRSMMLQVTDPALLELTGGIVQGMSGSPILQDGKLIGAVTHVLINDPSKGYAVSIEDMLSAAGFEDAA